MSLTLLDFILFGIMLISGLLALMRGFTREVLSLVAWVVAGLSGWYFAIKQAWAVEWAMKNVPYLDKDPLGKIAVGLAAFLVVLIVVSVISVKISDYVVDSSAGAFDRTLGFIYGVGRGFIFVVIAYLFYGWLLPFDKQEPWVRTAMSLPYIKSAGESLLEIMPADIAETLYGTALAKNPEEPGTATKSDAPGTPESGYKSNENQGLENLIKGSEDTTDQPSFGQSNGQ